MEEKVLEVRRLANSRPSSPPAAPDSSAYTMPPKSSGADNPLSGIALTPPCSAMALEPLARARLIPHILAYWPNVGGFPLPAVG